MKLPLFSIYFIFSLFLLLTLTFCSPKSGKNLQKTSVKLLSPDGHEYFLHRDLGGAKPKEGEYVYFHTQLRIQDTVLQSSRVNEQTPHIQIGAFEEKGQKMTPLEDVLTQIGIGDSATVIVWIDSLKRRPREFKDVDFVYYDLVPTEYLSEEEQAARLQRKKELKEKKKEEYRQRLEEVKAAAVPIVEKYNAGQLDEEIKTTDSGLKYLMLEVGNGEMPRDSNQTALVNYYLTSVEGKAIDHSYHRNDLFPVKLGKNRVIQGFEEGIKLLKVGGKAYLFVPPELGYGEKGSYNIPAGKDLIFYVELEKLKDK